MTGVRITLAAALAAGVALAAPAQADETLAKKYNCAACHTMERKSVGPSYKDIAKKYAGQADASARLAQNVKKGSSGVWGQIPMPPNAAVPDEDVKKLVGWILNQK
jgi:cytochrome c